MASEKFATMRFMGGNRFTAQSGSGHEITMDTAVDDGGENTGPSPMEIPLMALLGCTGMDVISILRKMRQDVTGYEVILKAERAPDHPRVFTRILVEHVVRGRNLNADAVRRAVELSATRYCPASAMLGKVAQIEEAVRVVDDATGATDAELAVTRSS